jgi:predicted O-linked N-acetylglucosamine transferase (SPINDLY family)
MQTQGARRPDFGNAVQQGALLLQQGKLAEAGALCARVLEAEPEHCDALHLLGVVKLRQGRAQDAAELIQRSLRHNPLQAQAYSNLGAALRGISRLDEALASINEALRLEPGLGSALNNRSAILLDLKRPEEALISINQAIAANPASASAHNNQGNALLMLGDPVGAAASFRGAIKLEADNGTYYRNLGKALLQLQDFDAALSSFSRALRLRPNDFKIADDCGYALMGLRQFAEALACFEFSLRQRPDDSDSLHNRALALMQLRRYAEAIASFDRAVEIDPSFALGWHSKGVALRELGHPERGAECFAKTLQLSSQFDYALGNLRYSRLSGCDWTDDERTVSAIVDAVGNGEKADLPCSFLSVTDCAQAQLQCARTYAMHEAAPIAINGYTGPRFEHRRIRLGYVSGDFCEHPLAYLMAGVFEHHDKSRFETVAIALRPEDSSHYGRRIRSAFEHYIDVSALSDAKAVARIRELEIDILVDLAGYTDGARSGIFARRPAPVQVNYLGFPGTLGAPYIDYLIADEFLIPPSARHHYTEQVVYLPECFQANDDRRPLSSQLASRAIAGLPDSLVVLCCFNNGYKLNRALFDVWMRLLHAAPSSVLWLVANSEQVRRNLRCEAKLKGIGPERLVFAERLPYAQHLARLGLADLFLDTMPFNGGATVSDALWAGLPVLTCTGRALAARMAGSLLNSVGLPELICASLKQYEECALQLLSEPSRLRAIRDRLAQRRQSASLFNTARFTAHLESAYAQMHSAYQRQCPPTHFAVPALP